MLEKIETKKSIALTINKLCQKKWGLVVAGKSKGTIKFFNSQKGFGFITPKNGGKELFVHLSNIVGKVQPQEGQEVEYVEGQGRKGPEATEVTLL